MRLEQLKQPRNESEPSDKQRITLNYQTSDELLWLLSNWMFSLAL